MSGSPILNEQDSTKPVEKGVEPASGRKRTRRRIITTCVVLLGIALLAGFVGWGFYTTEHNSGFQTPAHSAANADGIVAGGTGRTRVDVYVDYQCVDCKAFDASISPTLDKLVASKTITLVYHPVSMLDKLSATQYSTRSAASMACAADQNAFLPYSRWLLTSQPGPGRAALTDDQIVQIAGEAGIINPAFAQCERSAKYRTWVTHQNQLAAQKHVTTVPAVLVRGRSIAPLGQEPTLIELESALNVTK